MIKVLTKTQRNQSRGAILPFIMVSLVAVGILFAAFAQTWAIFVDREKNQRMATQGTMDALVEYYRNAASDFATKRASANLIGQKSVTRNYELLKIPLFKDVAPSIPTIAFSWGIYVQSLDTFAASADVTQVNAVRSSMPAVVGVGKIFGSFLPSATKNITFSAGFWVDDWGHFHEFETP